MKFLYFEWFFLWLENILWNVKVSKWFFRFIDENYVRVSKRKKMVNFEGGKFYFFYVDIKCGGNRFKKNCYYKGDWDIFRFDFKIIDENFW